MLLKCISHLPVLVDLKADQLSNMIAHLPACHVISQYASSFSPCIHTLVSESLLASAGILNNADKRRRYDSGGFDSLAATEVEYEVDISSLNAVTAAYAAFWSKMGECVSF